MSAGVEEAELTLFRVEHSQIGHGADAELAKVDRPSLTQAQKVALKLVESATQGKDCGSERLARYCVDRDEGKASEHLVIDKDNDLSDDECEEIRAVLRKAYADAS